MTKTIDYYFMPISPWAYLGGPRFAAMAKAHGARVNVKRVDYGRIFPASGGLPLAKRAPQRQAYRLVELRRWRDHLGMKLNLQPKHFPVPGDQASGLIIAADRRGLDALALTQAVMTAVWTEDRDISADDTLTAIAAACSMDGRSLLAAANTPESKAVFDGYTQEAMDRQVFGAPSYVVDGEIFWGLDRLYFLERKLSRG